MQAFKFSFKILKKYLNNIIIYIVIFASLMISFSVSMPADENAESSTRVAIINNDSGKIGAALKSYTEKRNNTVKIDDSLSPEDSLFYDITDYVLIIPEGFSEAILAGEEAAPQCFAAPGSVHETFMEMQISGFLSTAKAYLKNTSLTLEEALSRTANDLDAKSEVRFTGISRLTGKTVSAVRWMGYALILVQCVSLTSVLMAFNKEGVKKRIFGSSVSKTSLTAGKLSAFGLMAIGSTLIFNLILAIVSPKIMFSPAGGWILLNSACYTAVSAALAYLLSTFVKSPVGLNATANILGLGMSFLCGMFVPLELMSESVKSASKFLPGYYFSENISLINSSFEFAGACLANMGIMLLFAAAIISAGLLISRFKRRTD